MVSPYRDADFVIYHNPRIHIKCNVALMCRVVFDCSPQHKRRKFNAIAEMKMVYYMIRRSEKNMVTYHGGEKTAKY